jgi:hypothetical protein
MSIFLNLINNKNFKLYVIKPQNISDFQSLGFFSNNVFVRKKFIRRVVKYD